MMHFSGSTGSHQRGRIQRSGCCSQRRALHALGLAAALLVVALVVVLENAVVLISDESDGTQERASAADARSFSSAFGGRANRDFSNEVINLHHRDEGVVPVVTSSHRWQVITKLNSTALNNGTNNTTNNAVPVVITTTTTISVEITTSDVTDRRLIEARRARLSSRDRMETATMSDAGRSELKVKLCDAIHRARSSPTMMMKRSEAPPPESAAGIFFELEQPMSQRHLRLLKLQRELAQLQRRQANETAHVTNSPTAIDDDNTSSFILRAKRENWTSLRFELHSIPTTRSTSRKKRNSRHEESWWLVGDRSIILNELLYINHHVKNEGDNIDHNHRDDWTSRLAPSAFSNYSAGKERELQRMMAVKLTTVELSLGHERAADFKTTLFCDEIKNRQGVEEKEETAQDEKSRGLLISFSEYAHAILQEPRLCIGLRRHPPLRIHRTTTTATNVTRTNRSFSSTSDEDPAATSYAAQHATTMMVYDNENDVHEDQASFIKKKPKRLVFFGHSHSRFIVDMLSMMTRANSSGWFRPIGQGSRGRAGGVDTFRTSHLLEDYDMEESLEEKILLAKEEEERRRGAERDGANVSMPDETASSQPPTLAPRRAGQGKKKRNKRGQTAAPTEAPSAPDADVSDPFLYSVNVPYADREQLETLLLDKLQQPSRLGHVDTLSESRHVTHIFLARGMWDARYMAGHPLDLLHELEDLLVATRRLVDRSVRVVVMMPQHAHPADMPEINMTRLQDRPFLKAVFRERWHAMWHQRCMGLGDMERLRRVTRCALHRATWRLRRIEGIHAQHNDDAQKESAHNEVEKKKKKRVPCLPFPGGVYGLYDNAPRAEHERRYRQKCLQPPSSSVPDQDPRRKSGTNRSDSVDGSSMTMDHRDQSEQGALPNVSGSAADSTSGDGGPGSAGSVGSVDVGGGESSDWCHEHSNMYDLTTTTTLGGKSCHVHSSPPMSSPTSETHTPSVPPLFDVFDITDETSSALAKRFVDNQGHHYVDVVLEALATKLLGDHVCSGKERHVEEERAEEAEWEAACESLVSDTLHRIPTSSTFSPANSSPMNGTKPAHPSTSTSFRLPDVGRFNDDHHQSAEEEGGGGALVENATLRYLVKVGCACHLPRYASLCELGGEKGMEMELAEDRWMYLVTSSLRPRVRNSSSREDEEERSYRKHDHLQFYYPLEALAVAEDSNRTTGGW